MYSKIKSMRIPMELERINKTQKEHGLTCVPKEDSNFSNLIATIPGPEGSPYVGGQFKLSIAIGDQYPFRPPTFKFITPVFHPNIDTSGQICLDLLKMPPTGNYNPAVTLESILLSIQLLLSQPNIEDPIRGDIAHTRNGKTEYFISSAEVYSEKYAKTEAMDTDWDEDEVPTKKKKFA